MTVGALRDAPVEKGGTKIKKTLCIAQLQVDMVLYIDFLQENGMQLNCSSRELIVELTWQ